MRIIKTALFVCWLLLLSVAIASDNKHSYSPEDGFVTNAETAIQIAEAVWLPIYGSAINDKRPFTAELKIEYNLSNDANVKITILDVFGTRVVTLVDKYRPEGIYSLRWQPNNIPQGTYFLHINIGRYVSVKEIIYVK